jgi:hypothetical protein
VRGSLNGRRSEQKGRSRSTAGREGSRAGTRGGGLQCKGQGNDWVSGGYSCLPSCWFDTAGTGRERARSGGRRAGTTAVPFFLSCCAMPRCFRPSLSPIAEGWIHWEKEARLGAWVWPTATGSRRCPKSKARRRRPGSGSQWASASPPTDRGRWPVASQLSLLSCRIAHRFKIRQVPASCPTINNRT